MADDRFDIPTSPRPEGDRLPRTRWEALVRQYLAVQVDRHLPWGHWTPSSATIPTCSWPPTCSGIPSRETTRRAWHPDTMVAIGRPKGERGSYRQWDEAGHRTPGGLRSPVSRNPGGRAEAGVRVLPAESAVLHECSINTTPTGTSSEAGSDAGYPRRNPPGQTWIAPRLPYA